MAPDDLGGDRGLDVGQVEDAGLRGELGVEDDLEPEVAELAGQVAASRPPRARRRPRTPPRADACAARCGSARDPTGSRPAGAGGPRSRASPTGPRRRSSGATGGEVQRAGRAPPRRASRWSSRRPRRTGRPDDRPDRAARRTASGSAPPGPFRPGRGVRRLGGSGARPQRRQRDDQERPGRLDRDADQRLARDDLEAVRRIESPAESRLGDECVEQPALPLAGRSARDPFVAGDGRRGLLRVVPLREGRRGQLVELLALGRPRLLGQDLEQVDAVAGTDDDLRGLADRRREDGVGQLVGRAGPWRSSRCRRRCPAVGATELSRARMAKSAPLSAWSLSVVRWSASVGRYMTWMTCQPKADLTGSRISPSLRPGTRMAALNASSTVLWLSKNGSLPPLPVGPCACPSSLSCAGDRVEQVRVGLEPRPRRDGLGVGRLPGRVVGRDRRRRPTGRPSASTGCGGP